MACANPSFALDPPPPLGTPVCTGRSGLVRRDLLAEDVVGPSGQGVDRAKAWKLCSQYAPGSRM